MGFQRNRTYLLVFEDEDLQGLEVRARPAAAGHLLNLIELVDRVEQGGGKNITDVMKLIRMFAGCPLNCDWEHEEENGNHYVNRVKSWNLEDEDGNPIPTDYHGVMSQDLDFVTSMIHAWIDAQVGVSDELGKGSNSGGPSEEVKIPMETLSPALLS